MKGGSGDFGQYYVIKVDETSLAVYQTNGKTYSYFNMDRALQSETNGRIRCATDAIQNSKRNSICLLPMKKMNETRKIKLNCPNMFIH